MGGRAVPRVDQWFNGLHDMLFRTVHSHSLIYNACWEDPRVDRQLLEIDAASEVVMLTSAGCNALDYLLDRPSTIHAVDVNPRQNALLELKLAVIHQRSFADLAALFGAGAHRQHRALYAVLRQSLSVEARAFWDTKIRYFDPFARRGTFYYRGAAGSVAWFFSRCLVHLKRPIRNQIFALLNADSLPKQQEIYQTIEPLLWDRFSCWILQQPMLMAMLGVPRTQMQLAGAEHDNNLLHYIQARLRHVLTEVPLADNYFWRVYLTGQYSTVCCPNYLKPEHHATLQAHNQRIQLHTCTISQFLQRNPGRYTHFILLDHQDWLAGHDPIGLAEEWQQILDNSAPGTKILLRSAARTLDFLPDFVKVAVRFCPERTEPLHQLDRVGTYGSLHLAEVL